MTSAPCASWFRWRKKSPAPRCLKKCRRKRIGKLRARAVRRRRTLRVSVHGPPGLQSQNRQHRHQLRLPRSSSLRKSARLLRHRRDANSFRLPNALNRPPASGPLRRNRSRGSPSSASLSNASLSNRKMTVAMPVRLAPAIAARHGLPIRRTALPNENSGPGRRGPDPRDRDPAMVDSSRLDHRDQDHHVRDHHGQDHRARDPGTIDPGPPDHRVPSIAAGTARGRPEKTRHRNSDPEETVRRNVRSESVPELRSEFLTNISWDK